MMAVCSGPTDSHDGSGKSHAGAKVCTVNGDELLRIELEDRVLLVSAKCPHRGADMSRAYVSGQLLICERHGATFDLRTGGWVRGPLCGGITVIEAPGGAVP
jgi:nitrite reductase/ring-hydroxylating ferredoxin subunit